MQVVVLGGAGNIGSTVTNMLIDWGSANVIVFDLEEGDAPAQFHKVDLDVPGEFATALKGVAPQYVINCTPLYDPEVIKREIFDPCGEMGVHYLDLTEDTGLSDALRARHEEKQYKTAFIPHCGLAPGLVNIVSKHLVDHARKETGTRQLVSLEAHVGALTWDVDNTFRYVPTWSPVGVVSEYLRPTPIRHNGALLFASTLQSGMRKNMILNGTNYEAFITAGGLGNYAKEETEIDFIAYRSIRYPGHYDKLLEFFDVFEPTTDRDAKAKELIGYMENMFVYPARDYVLLHVSCVAEEDGRLVTFAHTAMLDSLQFDKKYRGNSAIQIATASGAFVALLNHALNHPTRTGFIAQHEIELGAAAHFLSSLNVPSLLDVTL